MRTQVYCEFAQRCCGFRSMGKSDAAMQEDYNTDN